MFASIDSLLSEDGTVIIKTGEVDSRHIDKSANYDWSIPSHVHFLGLKTIDRFRTPGRSRARNILKLAIAYIPFALKALKTAHEFRYGRSQIYSSYIVLSRRS